MLWSLSQFRALVESAPDATVVCDAEGRILLVNRQTERLFGHPRAELLGKTVEEFIPLGLREKHVGLRRQYSKAPSVRPMGRGRRLAAIRRDGTEFTVEISLSPIRTADRTLVSATIRDASDRTRTEKMLRRTRERLQRRVAERTAALEARSNELATQARRQQALAGFGRRIIASRSLDEVFEDAVGLLARELGVDLAKVLEVVPGADALLLRSGVGWCDGVVGTATVAAGDESQAGYTLRCDRAVVVDDLRTETRFRGPSLLRDHGVVSGMSVVIDGSREPFGVLGVHSRTQRRFTEEDVAFLQSVANLIGEAVERHDAESELREARQVALERARLADIGAIVAKIVHDFGNAVTGLSAQAQLVRRQAEQHRPAETLAESARYVVDEVKRLEALLREFRDFSRVDRLEIAPIDPPNLLDQVARGWAEFADERRIDLELTCASGLPALHADETKLRRVLDNLVKNAIEAIDEGSGRVRISAEAPGAEEVHISVEDSGAGLAPSVDPFRMFETTKKDGSGLGLPICRQIVAAHGGRIAFRPANPRGTVFDIFLPAAGPFGAASAEEPRSP